MLKYEWKKLLIHRRSIWLIVAMLLVALLSILLFTKPYDRVLEDHREVYLAYLEPVTGSLTEEKRTYIETEMERLNQIHREMERLKQDYYTGAVSEEEYRSRFPVLLADDQLYTGFGKLYSQYIFVREQENRFFLYTGGWEVLLTNQEPNYLFLLLLIIVLSPMFCEEYASRMHDILLTQKKSARQQVCVKLCVALALTIIMTAILQGMELLSCAAKFGLPHGDFSLQSLYSFGNAAKDLTLWQAFWLQFALKEIGYCYAAIMILFFSVLLKKYALTLMASISVLTLPFLTVESNDVFLRLPMPWALSLGSIYLNGSKSYTDSQTGEKITAIAELSMGEIGWLLLAVAVIVVCMLWYIRHKNTNFQLRGHKRAVAATLGCMVVLLCCGCSRAEEPVIYNSATSGWCAYGEYILANARQEVILIDTENNETYPFPADAFAEETVFCGSNFFCADGYVYYIRETQLHPSAGYDSSYTKSYLLMQVDLESMSETIRYQWNTERDWFFGLLDKESPENSPRSMHTFFLHGNDLYFLDSNEECLYKMNLTTGQYSTYLEGVYSSDIAYDGTRLYYADAYNRLVIHDLGNGNEQAMEEVITETFLLTPEGVYFLNRRDNNSLYFWETETNAVTKLADVTGQQLYYDAQYLWVMDTRSSVLYCLQKDGTLLSSTSIDGTICVIGEGQYIYYISYTDGNVLCALNKSEIS